MDLNIATSKNLTFDFLSPKYLQADKEAHPKEVWAIGGGKGGTGKTLFTANVGIKLAQSGKKVLLIDADLGGANLHTCLGLSSPKVTLGDFLAKDIDDIEKILTPTGVKNLFLINGSGDMLDVANLKHAQKMRFVKEFRRIDMDYVILDLGAGTYFNILDFFISSDVGILVIMPEPTSVENAYRFLKAVFYRKLRGAVTMPIIRRMFDEIISKKTRTQIKTPMDLLSRIETIDKKSYEAVISIINDFKIKIVMNQIKSSTDLEIGISMAKACKRYFGIEAKFLGGIHWEEKVWRSIQARVPVTLSAPESQSSKEFSLITQKLLSE
jgi:flagellar biosynthesis protein FlhG